MEKIYSKLNSSFSFTHSRSHSPGRRRQDLFSSEASTDQGAEEDLVKLLDDPGDEEPEPEGHDLMDFLEQYATRDACCSTTIGLRARLEERGI